MARSALGVLLALAATTACQSSDAGRYDSAAGSMAGGTASSSSSVVPPGGSAAASPGILQDSTGAAGRADSTLATASGTKRPIADVRLEVDIKARQVRLYRGTELLASHPVAVGSTEWPTRAGEWNVTQVVWNPEWIPPDESWAEERKPRKPGDRQNPLGQAQLVYDPPRSIHGTNDSASIGKAVSHGSIRANNSVVKALARQLMEATGAGKDETWYQNVQKNRTEKVIVDLPMLVPIRVF